MAHERPDTARLEGGAGRASELCRPAIARVDDRLIDHVVEELNRVQRETPFERALAIGALIVDRFYAGDLAVWRARAGKDLSFRRLVARAGRGLNLTAVSLYRAVALYELTQRLGISTWQHLSVSHVRSVLGLPDDLQRQLLAVAERARWTTKRLELETGALRRTLQGRRGRPPLPGFVKTIHRLGALIVERDALRVDGSEMACLGAFELERLARMLDRIQAALTDLQRQLASRPHCA